MKVNTQAILKQQQRFELARNTVVMGDFVQINVSNSLNDVISFEKKFPKDIKIADLKVNILNNFGTTICASSSR